MTGRTFILVPPSEAKVPGGSRRSRIGAFDEALEIERRAVLAALAAMLSKGNEETFEKVLKVRGRLLDRALESTRLLAADQAPLLAAWRRYNGVVWTYLNPGVLTVSQRRSILIPSGLYGITSATDLIGDYRLKMETRLAPLGNLTSYWRPHVTAALVAKVDRAVVVNLLPKEHEAAIDWRSLEAKCDVVTVAFVQFDGRVSVGHAAKAVKGAIARKILTDGLRNVESFCFEGWRVCRDGDKFVAVAPRV